MFIESDRLLGKDYTARYGCNNAKLTLKEIRAAIREAKQLDTDRNCTLFFAQSARASLQITQAQFMEILKRWERSDGYIVQDYDDNSEGCFITLTYEGAAAIFTVSI
jgi:hypothetical protein